MDWYLKVLKQYTRFNGRARRKEYWMFALVNTIIIILIAIVDTMLFGQQTPVLRLIYNFGILLPSLAVAVRRLHDIGKSGWWILINFIPLIGFIIFLVFTIQDSKPGRNRFGRNPKEPLEE